MLSKLKVFQMTASKHQRRVRFAEYEATTCCSTGSAEQTPALTATSPRRHHSRCLLTDDLCRELWYQGDEIETFRVEITELVWFGRTRTGSTNMEGLERYERSRSKHTQKMLKYLLHVQQILKTKKYEAVDRALGIVAYHSSIYATDIAISQGYHDYYSVYGCPPSYYYCVENRMINYDTPCGAIASHYNERDLEESRQVEARPLKRRKIVNEPSSEKQSTDGKRVSLPSSHTHMALKKPKTEFRNFLMYYESFCSQEHLQRNGRFS